MSQVAGANSQTHKMTRMTFACAVYSKFPLSLHAPPVAPTLFTLPFYQYQFHPPGNDGLPAVHVTFVNSVALWWGCARPVTRKLWRWESSVRSRVRMSASGGDTGSGADLRIAGGAVGFALIFHRSPKKERNFSATGNGFPVTSLQCVWLIAL
jgi:hypothetical protein